MTRKDFLETSFKRIREMSIGAPFLFTPVIYILLWAYCYGCLYFKFQCIPKYKGVYEPNLFTFSKILEILLQVQNCKKNQGFEESLTRKIVIERFHRIPILT